MEIQISKIEDLNLSKIENTTVFLLLMATNDNYKELKNITRYNNYPESAIVYLKDKSIDSRNMTLNEINKHCKKRAVYSVDSIVVFKIKNGKANFKSKRAINSRIAIESGIVSSFEDLINLVTFHGSKSFKQIDTEIKNRLKISRDYYASFDFSNLNQEVTYKVGTSVNNSKNYLFKRIVSV